MKERRILHMVIGILLCGCISAQQDVGYYFYSQDDIKNIQPVPLGEKKFWIIFGRLLRNGKDIRWRFLN